MPREKVVADARKMSHICDLWGQQENNPAEDDKAITKALGDDWMKAHGDTDIPIWYRQSLFRVVGARVHLMPFEPPLPLVARPRSLVGVTFSIRGRSELHPFVVINSH